MRSLVVVCAFLLAMSGSAVGQKAAPKPAPKSVRSVIFAVLNDGGMIEPIAYIDRGKLQATVNGSDAPGIIAAFNRTHYKPGTTYRLIFGGAPSGTVTVKKSDPNAECTKNMAQVTTKAAKTPLKGLVMGLATNAASKSTAPSFRRRPTTAEREEIEILVRAEYVRNKLTPNTLRYHNLTALDLENDGQAEMVGSYWIEIDGLTRGLLFFIAGKGANGKYSLGFSEYRSIDQASVMSGDIKDVDQGVYHELLLDAFDYDGDGIGNIFTYSQSFEGAGFTAYGKSGAKWVRTFEGSNYHCGY